MPRKKRKGAITLQIPWMCPVAIYPCPFCGFPTNDLEVDDHLADCPEALALKSMLGERFTMQLNPNILKQGAVANHSFVRVNHLGPGGKCVSKVVAVRQADASMQYSDFLIDLQIGRNTFTLGLRERNEDFIALARKFGLDTDRWHGKTVTLYKGEYQNSEGKKSDIVRIKA